MRIKRTAALVAVALATTALTGLVGNPLSARADARPEKSVHNPNETIRARNLPADGKVMFLLGQDSGTLHDFKVDVLDQDDSFPRPGGVTLYTNLTGAPMAGMYQSVDFGVGPTEFRQTLTEYGGALAVGLSLVQCDQQPLNALGAIAGTNPADVARYRGWLDEMINVLKKTQRAVYLRIGYEFDGQWNCYQPEPYKAAFRYVAQRIRQLDARNIATVWQSATWPGTVPDVYNPTVPGHWDQWYPGDAYVDWTAFSYFYGPTYAQHQWACNQSGAIATPTQIQSDFLAFTRAHQKPAMIAESAPQALDLGALTAGCIFTNATTPTTAQAIWDEWFADYLSTIRSNQDVIRAAAYINTWWQRQSNWYCGPGQSSIDDKPGCDNGYWGDTRLQADPTILTRFKNELQTPTFTRGPVAAQPLPYTLFHPIGDPMQAEYADVPAGWQNGAYGALALPDANASNGRTLFLNGNGVSALFRAPTTARRITIRFAAVTSGTISVLLDGSEVDTISFDTTGAVNNYVSKTVNRMVPRKAELAIRLSSGSVLWLDYVALD